MSTTDEDPRVLGLRELGLRSRELARRIIEKHPQITMEQINARYDELSRVPGLRVISYLTHELLRDNESATPTK